MPKVSVIVPNYNHEKYLERRLKSILGQTFNDYELIFLDDGSTDNSLNVYRSVKINQPLTEILSEVNSGSPFIQWNKGVSCSSGQYLWFAESDDWADSEFLSEMLNILDNHPEVGIAYCQSHFVDENDQTIGTNLEFTNDLDSTLWKNDFVMNGRKFCKEFELFKNPVHNASSALIRKSVWDKVGPADETMKRCGDWMQVVKILEISDIAFKSKPLNYYRNNPVAWNPQYPLIYDIKDEEYRIFTYIKNNFSVASKALNNRADQLCKQWLGRVIYNSDYSEYQKLMNVYKYYKQYQNYDDRIATRVIKNLVIEYFQKIQNKFRSFFRK
ncbi:MAG: hypothetical protein DHS20C13_06710 [Thermodesulfobacteriota bacterium]|nr:MAG: hypothetical protein DHS20C13_06710 [Thermodesulfobacteriota bacterium]